MDLVKEEVKQVRRQQRDNQKAKNFQARHKPYGSNAGGRGGGNAGRNDGGRGNNNSGRGARRGGRV